jgi:tRNA-dihydrouridine synthase
VEDAKRLYETTGCDGILIGRGARGNPWIFREISEYYKTGVIPKRPSQEEVLDMIMRHGTLLVECKGEYTGIREMRKHVAWYTAGMPHSAAIRNQVNQIETMSGLRELLGNLTL